jgi:hypothetical protein
MTDLKLTCPSCPGSVFTSWQSHYRTRAHRQSLARRRQAISFMVAMGRWATIRVGDEAWPVHLQQQVDGKYVATIYPPVYWTSPSPRYWRGESYVGVDEALRNAALLMVTEDIPAVRT